VNESAQLPRTLGLIDATCIIIGTVIGAGIFLVPSLIAREIPSAGGIIAVWIFAGVLSYFGALAYAELGAMYPSTGGQYVFLRNSFGPAAAFLFGWTLLLVVMPAQLGALAVGFAIYLGYFVTVPVWAGKLCGVTLIAFLTITNYTGVKAGAGVQNTLTAMKLIGLVTLILSAVFSPLPSQLTTHGATAGFSWTHLGVAVIACLLSYDGWNLVSCIAGEIKDPQRTFPRALALGLGVIMAVYVAFNLAVLRIIPVNTVAAASRVGADLASITLGGIGATLVALTILVSIMGSLNGGLITAPRLYFAQARDGLLFSSLGKVHSRYGTPAFAIALQGFLGALAALTGSYERLISYAIFTSWIFYAITIAGMMVLRRKYPNLPRPYKMWGYPLTPLLFLIVAIAFVVNTIVTQPATSVIGLLIILAGAPIYWLSSRRTTIS
jgi:APA family basic amino acid/polyamine antiporter